MTGDVIAALFLKFSCGKLQQLSHVVSNCLAQLSHEQVWARRQENDNSVGNLVLHVCGTVNEWILVSIAGHPNTRRREEEFATNGGFSGKQLSGQLSSTVMQATAVIEAVDSQRLWELLVIQTHELSVLEAIYHTVEHFGVYSGQIMFATKLLTGQSLYFGPDVEGLAGGLMHRTNQPR